MARGWWSRLLQPASDVGVAVQLLVLVTLAVLLWRATSRRPEWRLVVVGGAVLAAGLVGLRAAH